MEYFDSHCHLDPMRYGDELPQVIARARAAGLVGMTLIGTRASDSEAAAELASRESGFVAAAGIHPNDVAAIEPDEWDRITRLVVSGRVAAIGETGLDWYRDSAPRDVQREFFDRHIRLAQSLGLPLVVHTRDSIRDTLDTIRDALARGPLSVVLHAFTGTQAEAEEAVSLGCCLGFAGMVTFRSAAALREVAALVPAGQALDRDGQSLSLPGALARQAERTVSRRAHSPLPRDRTRRRARAAGGGDDGQCAAGVSPPLTTLA